MNIDEEIAALVGEDIRGTELLRGIIDIIRPPRAKKIIAQTNCRELIDLIQRNEGMRLAINQAISATILRSDLQFIFGESGLLTGTGFFSELSHKMVNKLLPTLLPDHDLRGGVRKIFHKQWDHKWVYLVESQTWVELFKSLHLDISVEGPDQSAQMLRAAEALSYRVAALGLDKRIVRKAAVILTPLNAFVEQNKIWQHYSTAIKNRDINRRIHLYGQLQEMLEQGLRQVANIREVNREKGTSLQQTFILERIHQQLERLKIVITVIDPDVDVTTATYTRYFKGVVKRENTHNKLRSFLSTNFSYLAYQIAEHGSHTGEKYITTTGREYRKFFTSACIGGFIITFAAMLKIWLTHYQMAPFWISFVLGINYAMAFVIIHLLHGSIATKQPALTASAIATALDNTDPRSPSLNNLALLMGKVFRSQLASLAGNLVIVFPLSIGFAWGFHQLFGVQMVTPEKTVQMLQDIGPSVSNIWFAAVAGVLLFMSGIVSGYFDNMVVFGNIPQRIRAHKRFKKWLGARGTIRLSNYVDKNLGALMGNILLGFGLGFMMFFGKIFGIPLDIRHVTISTGFFGVASYVQGFPFHTSQWVFYITGLLCIALTNLLVSFALALFVAMKSKRVSTTQLFPLIKLTGRYFLKYPKDFFFPPKRERLPDDLARKKKMVTGYKNL